MKEPHTVVIIPAFNEEDAIGKVVQSLPREVIREILVVDNGSCDRTAEVARSAGARVVAEPRQGYGAACLAGIACLSDVVEVVLFMDGDFSDRSEEIPLLLKPIINHEADLVIGSRILGRSEKGALTPQQRIGNWLATRMIRLLYGFRYTDLGPFRAITVRALRSLNMQDRNFGWTAEMQVRALQQGLRVVEVPVNYRKRVGKSKISGTLTGSIRAGLKIPWTIAKLTLRHQTSKGR
jgi:glycosyltransferase involved in cell wall biosynthesis